MSFELLSEDVVPEHARDVKRDARDFAVEHIAPNAEEYYRNGEYPREILEAGMDAGLVAQDISEEYGGRGLDLTQMLAIAEEFFRADAGIALTLQLASFGAELMEEYGSEEQKEQFLRPVAENDQITGLAVSEPDVGSDLAGMETTAEKVERPGGDAGDEYVLNGEKYWIGNGVEADWVTVYAKTGDTDDRYMNYSLFAVPTDTDGYDAEHVPEKMGMRASKQALADMRLEFEAARALAYRAAEKVEAHDQPGLWAAMAKTKATEVATANAEQGMQFHGGRSILTDRRIARVYRDVRIPVIYEGANEIQRNLIYRQSAE